MDAGRSTRKIASSTRKKASSTRKKATSTRKIATSNRKMGAGPGTADEKRYEWTPGASSSESQLVRRDARLTACGIRAVLLINEMFHELMPQQ